VTRKPRLKSAAATLALLLGLGAAGFLFLTRPARLTAGAVPSHRADLANGELLFHAGSCLTCHRPADEAASADKSLPSGGVAFRTPVGTFFPQNLTPDRETGLGAWSEADFLTAMSLGVSPDGRHYFPAFPYGSYRLMRTQDLLDLWGYLKSLPAVRSPRREAEVPFERLARRGVGLWQRLAFDAQRIEPELSRSASWNRGAYLANAPGHCGECHTPRDLFMVLDESRHFAGAPHPGGEGQVPGLRGLLARKRYKDVADLTLALQHGETFGYEKLSSGGMAAIQENIARLPEGDVQAIAEYLLSLN
jgi:mono/diheme cytochrome c family protein